MTLNSILIDFLIIAFTTGVTLLFFTLIPMWGKRNLYRELAVEFDEEIKKHFYKTFKYAKDSYEISYPEDSGVFGFPMKLVSLKDTHKLKLLFEELSKSASFIFEYSI